MDDLKISHKDPDIVSDIIDKLYKQYGELQALTVTRGKVHDFIGMTLDYTEKGMVIIVMRQYVKKLIDEAPNDFDGTSPTPAAKHLFEIDASTQNMPLLTAEKKKTSHHITAQLLFLSKRARPDIQTAVASLTTRVTRPEVHDWKKLGRVIKYFRGTADLDLTLEAESLNIIKWWADGAFSVHNDAKGQSGAVMSLGKGVFITQVEDKY